MPADPLATLVPAAVQLSDELRDLSRTLRTMRESWREQTAAPDRTAQCVELAKLIYHHRRTRGHLLPMFETFEPNWHMALALYIAGAAGTSLTLLGLCRAARLSTQATRRRLNALAAAGAVARSPDPAMPRRAAYRLTADGDRGVREYLTSVVLLLS